MARIHFSAKTVQNIAAARNSHIRTILHQIGAVRQDSITPDTGIDQNQSETSIDSPGYEMRYVNIANELFDSDEKQVMLTQTYSVFVVGAKRNDTDCEIAANCAYITIDTFRISLYSPMLIFVDTCAPFPCIRQNTVQIILRRSEC